MISSSRALRTSSANVCFRRAASRFSPAICAFENFTDRFTNFTSRLFMILTSGKFAEGRKRKTAIATLRQNA